MKKYLSVLFLVLATSVMFAQRKTMIVLQENGGKFTYIDNYISGKTEEKIETIIDKLAEGFESLKSTLVSQGYYASVIDLTDANCARQKLLDKLIEESKKGNLIDLYIFGHGGRETLYLYGNQTLTGQTERSNGNIRSLLTDARAREGATFNFKLRLVYMCNCIGGSTNDDWIAAGAKVSVGSRCYNALTEPMITYFMNKFIRENKPVATAMNESYEEAKVSWQVYNSIHNLGLNNPAPGDGCGIYNVFESSKPILSGDATLRFGTVTPVQFFENSFIQGGIILQNAARTGTTAANDAAQTISFNASNILDNLTGDAISNGTYYIKCLKSGKYLDISASCMNSNGCKSQLWSLGNSTSNNKFVITKQFPVGYTIRCYGCSGTKFLEVNGQPDKVFDNGTEVQTYTYGFTDNPATFWNDANANTPNQIWLFYKIADGKYIIRNLASLKVIDANDDCVTENGCKVKQWSAISNDATQVWVLEKQ